MGNKQKNAKPCPNCGHCPTCGHSPQNLGPWYPYYPWYPVAPIEPYIQPYITWGNITCHTPTVTTTTLEVTSC